VYSVASFCKLFTFIHTECRSYLKLNLTNKKKPLSKAKHWNFTVRLTSCVQLLNTANASFRQRVDVPFSVLLAVSCGQRHEPWLAQDIAILFCSLPPFRTCLLSIGCPGVKQPDPETNRIPSNQYQGNASLHLTSSCHGVRLCPGQLCLCRYAQISC
jgi:hypothetical protein